MTGRTIENSRYSLRRAGMRPFPSSCSISQKPACGVLKAAGPGECGRGCAHLQPAVLCATVL